MGPQRYAALKQRCRNCVRFQHVLPQTLALRPFPDTRRATGVFKVPSINPHVTTGQLAVIVERPLVGDTRPIRTFCLCCGFQRAWTCNPSAFSPSECPMGILSNMQSRGKQFTTCESVCCLPAILSPNYHNLEVMYGV
jgi:hypothetical protein